MLTLTLNYTLDDGVNSFLCQVKDVPSLAGKMEKMLYMSGAERVEMGNAGRKKVLDDYAEQFVLDEYLDAIREVISVPDPVVVKGFSQQTISNEKFAYLAHDSKPKL